MHNRFDAKGVQNCMDWPSEHSYAELLWTQRATPWAVVACSGNAYEQTACYKRADRAAQSDVDGCMRPGRKTDLDSAIKGCTGEGVGVLRIEDTLHDVVRVALKHLRARPSLHTSTTGLDRTKENNVLQ